MFKERNSKMRKILVSLLMGGFCCLTAMDEAVWIYDLDAATATRTMGEFVTHFTITRERSADPVEVLPEGAAADTWYPIFRKGTVNLKANDGSEEIKDQFFELPVSELMYTVVDGRKSKHGHFGEPFEQISKWKKKKFFKCWECEGTELLARVLRRDAGTEVETIVRESIVGLRHDRKHYIRDFTNPGEQDYETGKITPAPEGVGDVNRQVLENTFKGLGAKLGI
jgi:hypothetical protein